MPSFPWLSLLLSLPRALWRATLRFPVLLLQNCYFYARVLVPLLPLCCCSAHRPHRVYALFCTAPLTLCGGDDIDAALAGRFLPANAVRAKHAPFSPPRTLYHAGVCDCCADAFAGFAGRAGTAVLRFVGSHCTARSTAATVGSALLRCSPHLSASAPRIRSPTYQVGLFPTPHTVPRLLLLQHSDLPLRCLRVTGLRCVCCYRSPTAYNLFLAILPTGLP